MKVHSLRQLLRSPGVIVGEIASIALAGALGAAWPAARVFQSVWFPALALLAAASLAVVVVEQFRRLRVLWSLQPSAVQFESAPFHTEFERPARPAGAQTRVWTERRIGLSGAAVLHAGLLLVIVAGVLRAWFAAEASVDLIEGETLPPTAAAWGAQWPGALAKPIQLSSPVTLGSLTMTRYGNGEIKSLLAQIRVGDGQSELHVNRRLAQAGGSLFLGSDFGSAALVEWRREGADPVRQAALLASQGKGSFAGPSAGPDGLRAYLRADIGADGHHPAHLDVRVMQDRALLFAGLVPVGGSVALPGGRTLALQGAPFWVRLHASRDAALWMAYLGFALVMAGAAIVFTLVKVDACVIVTPLGDRERVFVALKPQRFPPLFAERFQRLAREQGAPA